MQIKSKIFFGSLKYLSFLTFLVISFGSIKGQNNDRECSVLFIGNSYTYFNSMPQMFKAIFENQHPNRQIRIKFIGGPGETLKDHWESGEAKKEIKSGKWNYVVLQEQSMLGSNDLTDSDSPKQFYKYARLFDNEIKSNNAQTIFFMTWAREYLPDQQKYLTNAYETIGKELGSKVAPVGEVWKMFKEMSTAELYSRGGSHPTVVGSYLCALTLYGTIFNKIPENLSGKLFRYSTMRSGKISSDKEYLCDFTKADLKLMKAAVCDLLFP